MAAKETNAETNEASTSSKKAVLPYMQNRELSWLTFNKRVLDQGEDKSVPLIERLTFVSIFSSNLQEFFMVRVGSLTDLSLVKQEIRENKTLMTPQEQLDAVYERCHELYPEQERIYHKILNKLAKQGIHQLLPEDLNEEQAEYLHKYLEAHVIPYLSPQIINARHPFPHLENGKLYVLLRLDEEKTRAKRSGEGKKKQKNLGAEDATFGLIPLPSQAKRVITLPGEGTQFILLENALKTVVDEVFSMYVTKRASVICVTRNADIDPNDSPDDMDYDYREHMKRILKKRSRLAPVRLETDTPLSAVTEKFLLKRLNLKPHQVFVTSVPLDMGYAWGLADMVDKEVSTKLTNKPFTPAWPAAFDRNKSIIEQVSEKDVLLSYPYESMDAFIKMLYEAAADPDVVSIKITLYRLASQSHLAEALVKAAENGKQVMALFELRARFDEFNNIEWSHRFEEAGAQIIYGFHDFKVHSKICAITRRTDDGLQYITQLGTGNYNEKTSKLYTDFSFITTDEAIGKDAAEFFRNMSLENASDSYRALSVAPLQIKPMILRKIDEQIELARKGEPCGLVFKTNSITDKGVIDKIAEASQAGVHTTLFVRGISCLVPGVKGYTENVEVVSIVGRLLEHSRIYGFGPAENRELYLSSADLMTRNMEKRVEIAWPITSPELKKQVNDYLAVSLSDTAKLRKLLPNLDYTPLGYFVDENEDGRGEPFNSQNYLIDSAQTAAAEAVQRREEEAAQRSAKAQVLRMQEAEAAAVAAAATTTQYDKPGEADAAESTPASSSDSALQDAAEAPEATPAETTSAAEEPAATTEAAAEAEPGAASAKTTEPTPEPPAANTSASGYGDVPTQGTFNSQDEPGIVEVEPGVAGPEAFAPKHAAPSAAQPQPAPEPTPEPTPVTATPIDATPGQEISLVPKEEKKPGLLARLKFLFTGKL